MHLLCRVHHSQLTALTRERYVTIFTKIALALLEEDEREDPDKALQECRDLANEAWESDAKGADTLPKHKWLDSLFELADTSPKLALAGSVPATERDGLLIMV